MEGERGEGGQQKGNKGDFVMCAGWMRVWESWRGEGGKDVKNRIMKKGKKKVKKYSRNAISPFEETP